MSTSGCEVRVVVPLESLRRATSGAVTGQLWLEVEVAADECVAYPEAGWWDFPVPVLTWWLDALASLGAPSVATCRFMDGPHVFTVEEVDARLKLQNDRWSCASTRPAFDGVLRGAALAVLAECDRQGWSSRDILDLRRAVRSVPRAAR
jgi:hypothetical protein